MAGKGAITTMTFAVTFQVPQGANIPFTRAAVKNALIQCNDLGIKTEQDVKVHLINKEVSYGKR